MNATTRLGAVIGVVLLAGAGCATKQDHYHWGQYESLIYAMYLHPGEADANTQIAKLSADIGEANSLGKPVPPGVYAHLGYMYAIAGQPDKAEDAFHQEKALYPESAVLLDGMMQRARRGK